MKLLLHCCQSYGGNDLSLPSPAELESGKKELKRSQDELARKIEHQFKGQPV